MACIPQLRDLNSLTNRISQHRAGLVASPHKVVWTSHTFGQWHDRDNQYQKRKWPMYNHAHAYLQACWMDIGHSTQLGHNIWPSMDETSVRLRFDLVEWLSSLYVFILVQYTWQSQVVERELQFDISVRSQSHVCNNAMIYSQTVFGLGDLGYSTDSFLA